MSATASIILYGLVAGAATSGGVALLVWKERWAHRHVDLLTAFAAGVILGVVFFHMLPESGELNQAGFLVYCAVGFLAFYFLENILVIHGSVEHSHTTTGEGHLLTPTALVSTVGIGLHSLLDGIIIGIGFQAGREIGMLTAAGVICHEVPEGIAILAVLFESKVERKRAITYSLAVAVATPVGALLSLAFIPALSDSLKGGLLAAGAGTFLYVAASDLIPITHRRGSKFNVVLLLAGVALLVVVKYMLGE
jgi:ZIP family zinc transporter/zinc and cadmium transporter